MGDPKATETPEAAAADRTSRFRATNVSQEFPTASRSLLTFIVIDVAKQFRKDVCATAGDMNQRAFFS